MMPANAQNILGTVVGTTEVTTPSATNATYTPIVAKDAWAKLGTLVVMYVSVRPILSNAKRLAKIIASENIGSNAKPSISNRKPLISLCL
jgi:hypothetical protein